MRRIAASYAGVLADYDHGEGWLVIQWPDALYGHDELKIDFDGFCSRRMPIYSGSGPLDYVKLTRDRLHIHFHPTLAEKLKLDEEIEFTFNLADDSFEELRCWVDFWKSDDD